MKRYVSFECVCACVCSCVVFVSAGFIQAESAGDRVIAFAPAESKSTESSATIDDGGLSKSDFEKAAAKPSASITLGQLEWHTDYFAAYQQAEREGKMLFLFFKDSRQPQISESFLQVLAKPELHESLGKVVRAVVPVDTTLRGADQPLMAHQAFEHMQRRQGIAVLDLTEKSDQFGKVVSAHPFSRGKHYTARGVQLILNLPHGTVTQRALIYAVRLHPAAPQCTTGTCHAALLLQANKGSKLMAQYESVGHHDWGTRYNEVALATNRSAMEVAAAAFAGQSLIDAAIQCVDMWYGSPTHWGMMQGPCAVYGFDLVRSASGTWYGTGVFAN